MPGGGGVWFSKEDEKCGIPSIGHSKGMYVRMYVR